MDNPGPQPISIVLWARGAHTPDAGLAGDSLTAAERSARVKNFTPAVAPAARWSRVQFPDSENSGQPRQRDRGAEEFVLECRVPARGGWIAGANDQSGKELGGDHGDDDAGKAHQGDHRRVRFQCLLFGHTAHFADDPETAVVHPW